MAKKWMSTVDMYKAKERGRRKRMGISTRGRRKRAPAGCLVSLLSLLCSIGIISIILSALIA